MRISFLFLLLSFNLHAQKEDYIWHTGYLPNLPEEMSGGTRIDFNTVPPSVSFHETTIDLLPVAVFSNAEGNLLFYSSGCSVVNSENNIMNGGDDINMGDIASQYCPSEGYPCVNCITTLSVGYPSQEATMLHLRRDNSTLYKDLLCTTIDLTLDNGLGAVTEKNQLLLQDTFTDHLTSVRHGNGRDWWFVTHKGRSNVAYVYRLDPEGIHPQTPQALGPVWTAADWSGQSVFSPDGTLYARGNPYNGIQVYGFDRCSGVLSEPVTLSLATDGAHVCGLAFSPNSRYLYASTGSKLFQYDVTAADIAASRILVGEYDGFLAPFPTNFYNQRLAPDGKIYMASTNGVYYLHVINNPDGYGLNCEFAQHQLELPTYIAVGLPNVPYVRLFDLEGSVCDTLGINGGPVGVKETDKRAVVQVEVFPNPATDAVTLRLPEHLGFFENLSVDLYDAFGKKQLKTVLSGNATTFSVEGLAPGIYQIVVRDGQEVVGTGKVAVVR